MNKTIRLALVGALLQIVMAANACWYATFSPIEYYTCHIPTVETPGNETMVELWHRTMLPDVGAEEIAKLIFSEEGYSLEQIRRLEVSPELRSRLAANNNALLEYVCTMRRVNDQRARMSNPWYYYYAGEPRSAELNELADSCLARLDTRYGDRYALLAARALNTLKRYDALDSLARNHTFKHKDVEAIFRPEYAGVLYNMGKYEEAAEIYAKAGDMTSLRMCLKKLGAYQNELSVISRLAEYDSNYNLVVNELSRLINSLENKRYYGYRYGLEAAEVTTAVGSLIETAHVLAASPGTYRPLWLYAEAIGWLIDSNDFAKADSALARIDAGKADAEFAKSIRALRFITQSRLKPYDSKYLPWVASEAEWLIGQSDRQRAKWPKRPSQSGNQSEWDSTRDEDESLSYGREMSNDLYEDDSDAAMIMFNRNTHVSALYFSDMLHKAADVIIVPRMLEHGDTIAALQLLDIVDYANFSDKEVCEFDTHGNASACFAVECGADVIANAIARSKNPRSSLDRLWNKIGSIRQTDRWLDLAGTTLLAEGRYREAAKYFKMVSPRYAKGRNIDNGRTKNPFAVELRADAACRQENAMMPTPSYYKLWFAEQMSKLETAINNPTLSDEQRAEARLKYGIGMTNSVYPCWPLTRFGEGETVFYPWTNESDSSLAAESRDIGHNFITNEGYGPCIEIDPFARSHQRLARLRRKGEAHIAAALCGISDPETMAAYLRSMGHYRTIKRHYASTSIARELSSHCDRWSMY